MARHDWRKQEGLCPIRSYLPDEDFKEEMRSWLEIEGLAGQTGRMRKVLAQKRDQLFGKGKWALGWRFEARTINRTAALALYEESYFLYLKSHSNLLDWLCSVACEVYDNSMSNIESGLDYGIQETEATHLQDISIRRSLLRLDRKLEGDHPVQVRGHNTEGYTLNPGQIPFHRSEEILPRDKKAWWKPDSVEAFWQHNKVLLVHPDSLMLQPQFLGPEGLWGRLDEKTSILLPRRAGECLQARPTKIVRSLWCSVKRTQRKHRLILNAPIVCYKKLASLSLPEFEAPEAGRISWSELAK